MFLNCTGLTFDSYQIQIQLGFDYLLTPLIERSNVKFDNLDFNLPIH